MHGSYLWFAADVPSAGRGVVLQLRVRRFTCRNAECGRRTFVAPGVRVAGLPVERRGRAQDVQDLATRLGAVKHGRHRSAHDLQAGR
ncbi:hypothetical protein ACWEQC_13710 [Streptomyces shenzhenensis]